MHKRAAATVVTSDGSLKMDRRTKTHTRTPGRLAEARDTCGLVFAVCSVSTRLYRKRYKLAWHCLFVCLFISSSANMFRSGRPQIGCPTPHPTPPQPTPATPAASWGKNLCLKIRSDFRWERIRPCSTTAPPPEGLFLYVFLLKGWAMTSCRRRQYFPSAATSGVFGPPGEVIPPWTTSGPHLTVALGALFLLQKSLHLFFSFHFRFFFFGKERHRPPSFSRVVTWLFRHMRSTMQCVWHWMNEWMIKRWANVFMGTCTSRGQRWWTAKPYCVIFLCLTNSCQSV